MGLILPTALALSALAIPIIIFYMLRLRRQPAKISSLLLWQRVLEDQTANAPWQRVRRNLLLLLQLLILALLVLALARPFRTVEARVQGNVILLLDSSASMQARDVSPSRLERAKSEALSIIRALRPGDTVSLIAVEAVPRPLLTAEAGLERNALEAAVRDIEASGAVANWEPALALAAASATSQANSTVVIISDGAIPTGLPSLPSPVQWLAIGEGSDNRGIVALAAREGRQGPQLFVQVANFADAPAEALVEIQVDGQLFDARNIELAPYPEGVEGLTFTNLPQTASLIEARLSQADDFLADNAAWTQRRQTGGQVLLVSRGNLFLERAFSLIPGLSVAQISPDNYPTEGAFDLTVFDRTIPDTVPDGNLLFIAPPDSTPLFSVRAPFTNTLQSGRPQTDHPILTFVDFENLHVSQAQAVEPPPWSAILLNSRGGPLIIAGEADERRVAIITFDLLKSDLPLQIDFPILISNLTTWFLNQPTTQLTNQPTNLPPQPPQQRRVKHPPQPGPNTRGQSRTDARGAAYRSAGILVAAGRAGPDCLGLGVGRLLARRGGVGLIVGSPGRVVKHQDTKTRRHEKSRYYRE